MINYLSILLVIISAFLGAMATGTIKRGVNKYSFKTLMKSKYLWLGALFYAISVVFYVVALRKEELSVLYPIVSTTYIWTTIFSVKYLDEKLNKWKIIGLFGIIIGIILIGLGS